MKKLLLLYFIITLTTGCHTRNMEAPFEFEPYHIDIKPTSLGNQAVVIESKIQSSCSNKPSQEEILTGTFRYTDRLLTYSQAFDLKIPMAKASGSNDYRVFVRDWRRYKTCSKPEDKSESNLMFGQMVRIVVEIQNYKASMGVDLETIASYGTIEKNSQSLMVYSDGIDNSKISSILDKINGKPFNTANYHLFNEMMSDLNKIIQDPNTKFSVNFIGYEKDLLGTAREELIKAPIISYTLSQIKKNNSCFECKKAFGNDNNSLRLVEDIYKSLGVSCSNVNPGKGAQLKAKEYLQGIKVR